MKDSTKKWLTITGGLVICAILVFVIAQQFTKEKATDALPPTSTVISAPITSRRKTNLPTHVSINRQVDKLRCNSVILMEQIRTIDKSRLMDRIGVLNDYEMQQVNQALGISVGLV